MRLVIVSHMPHHLRDGVVVGWGPTVQEIDQLATRFDEVRHVACLHAGPAPASALPYASKQVTLVPVPPTGGDSLAAKLDVVRTSKRYVTTILHELSGADVVHLRCPANVPMFAAALLPFIRRPRARWIKYAGNWRPTRHDSWPFAFQRFWLARPWHRGVVTVNGDWPGQPGHVRSFYNPSLSDEDLAEGRTALAGKRLSSPLRLLFVGRLEEAKGTALVLEVAAALRERGLTVALDLVGGGEERAHYEAMAARLGLTDVTFHGWLPRTKLGPLYARAHVLLLPTASEGWPKVVSEGMAYGVVPVVSAVSAIPQYLERFGLGRAIPAGDLRGFVDAVAGYAPNPEGWRGEAVRAVDAAQVFSYRHYLSAVDALLDEMGAG